MKLSPTLRGLVLAGVSLHIPAAGFAVQCKIGQVETPVTMRGLHPTISAKINGKDAIFELFSGVWWSSITPATAEQYQLHMDKGKTQEVISSLSGRRTMQIATADTFDAFNTSFRKIEFLVGNNYSSSDAAGMLGGNFLSKMDVEYDLAQGSVKLLKTSLGCRLNSLAYWGKVGERYSLMDIERTDKYNPHTIGTAYLNGNRTRAWFNTGSAGTMVGLATAERAGVKPGDPGVEKVNFGTQENPSWGWIGTFASLKIGDEEIHNARLPIGNLGWVEMMIGADFFLSHHVLVSNSQSKLYFTYNGGPVFNYEKAVGLSKTEKTASALPERP